MVTVKIDWIKMQTDMYDNPKIKVIDSMEDNNLIHYIWTRSILLAGKSNMGGDLYLTSKMPYTMKTLAIEFNRTVEEVKRAYKVLLKFEMIELTEDKVFRIKNWSKYQSVDELEKIRKQNCARVAKYREKKREEKRAAENNSEEIKDDNKKNSESIDDFDKSTDGKNSESFKIDNNSSDESEEEDVKKIDEEVKSNGNVTCNDDNNSKCNKTIVTVMQENKKETKKKNKKKREKDNEEDGVSQSDDISSDVIELSNYCEEITGRVGILDIGALKLLVNMHGKENVKKAINKAIELGKTNMPYISGILSNWRKEGYPNDDVGGNKYGGKCNNKDNESDTNKFKDFKPKEPRKLSEEERKKASASVV